MSGPGFVCSRCRSLLGSSMIRRPQSRPYSDRAPVKAREAPRIAIVGSGPAGFYSAARLLQKVPHARVDMYEKLPVPFGLVRYGVAPDHPEVKNCQDRFNEVATSPRFTFIGNAAIGTTIPLGALTRNYDAMLFAYGAAKDRKLGIPGEDLAGVYSARAFVGWYNGLPEHANLAPNLDSEHALVIGNGNVALDVARVLLTSVDALRSTDITESALDALSRSRVRRVTVAGRRGPMQAAFTIKEVRELMRLPNTLFYNPSPELLPTASHIAALPRLEQRKYRLARLISESAVAASSSDSSSAGKAWSLLSLISPTAFYADEFTPSQLAKASFAINEYADPSLRFDPTARVVATGDVTTIDTALAFRSIGYQALPLPGITTELGVGFDSKQGIMHNDGAGRALSPNDTSPDSHANDIHSHENASHVVPGVYCAGWVKTGPTGVIASTMEDAFATADAIAHDWTAGSAFLNDSAPGRARGWDALRHEVELEKPLHWDDWLEIDRYETALGKKQGRPRDKITSIGAMLQIASHGERTN